MRHYAMLLPIIALLALFAPPAQTCLACSCVPPPPAAKFSGADSVFQGRVVAVSGETDGYVGKSATFRISTVWKGQPMGEVTVVTDRYYPHCGKGFVRSEEYLVYANGNSPSALNVQICFSARLLRYLDGDPFLRADLAYLGSGSPIGGGQGPPTGFGMALAAHIAAGLP